MSMENEIYLIYDRIFKRIFALSTLAIINMINALFHTNYSQESVITQTSHPKFGHNA